MFHAERPYSQFAPKILGYSIFFDLGYLSCRSVIKYSKISERSLKGKQQIFISITVDEQVKSQNLTQRRNGRKDNLLI